MLGAAWRHPTSSLHHALVAHGLDVTVLFHRIFDDTHAGAGEFAKSLALHCVAGPVWRQLLPHSSMNSWSIGRMSHHFPTTFPLHGCWQDLAIGEEEVYAALNEFIRREGDLSDLGVN